MIDSHHHLWSYSAEDYPWIPADSPLARDYLLPELEAATASAEVEGTIVVQARQTLAESDWLLSLAEQSDLIQGVIGWLPLADREVCRHVEQWVRHPKFKGARHVLQDEPDEYFLRDDFHRGLGCLAEHRVPYDLLLFQRQLPAAVALLDRQPELQVIVDHIAKPTIRNGRIEPNWRTGMKELARRDNVVGVKISGMVTEVADARISFSTIRRYFDETLEMFGADRLMFGSDWPVCLLRLDDYREWADWVRDFIQPLSSDERNAILRENANHVYRLNP